jgi:hypothetical protein
MVLLVVEGSSSSAVAGMAPELMLMGMVGLSMSGRAAAVVVVAVDKLDAVAPNRLSRTKTFWGSLQGRRGGRPVARSLWRFALEVCESLILAKNPDPVFESDVVCGCSHMNELADHALTEM